MTSRHNHDRSLRRVLSRRHKREPILQLFNSLLDSNLTRAVLCWSASLFLTMLASYFIDWNESAPPSLLVVVSSFVAAPSLLYLSAFLCSGSQRFSLAFTSFAIVLCASAPEVVARILLLRSELALETDVTLKPSPSTTTFLSSILLGLDSKNIVFLNGSCLLALASYIVITRRQQSHLTVRCSSTITLLTALQRRVFDPASSPALLVDTRQINSATQTFRYLICGQALLWLATMILSVLSVLPDLAAQALKTPDNLALPCISPNKNLPGTFNVVTPASDSPQSTDEQENSPKLVAAPGPPPKASRRTSMAPISKNRRLLHCKTIHDNTR